MGTEHILLGLIHEGDGLAAKVLESLDISLEAVRHEIEATVGPAPDAHAPTGSPPFTRRAKRTLELSLREAFQFGHNYIGTEQMLLGIVREGEGVAAQVLVSLGTDLSLVRVQVIQLLAGYQGPDPGAARASGPDTLADAPRCPYCGVGLVDRLRHRTLESRSVPPSPAPSDEVEDESGSEARSAGEVGLDERLPVLFVYCGSCGKALGIRRWLYSRPSDRPGTPAANWDLGHC